MADQIVYIELDEKLEPNEEFKGITTVIDGDKIGIMAVIEIWESASAVNNTTRLGKIKVVN